MSPRWASQRWFSTTMSNSSPVNDQQALAVGGFEHIALAHLDAAEMHALIFAQQFVVVARHIDDAGALRALRSSFWTTSLWDWGQ